jgi:light-independent protochlorophyllide reductase subunit B
MEVEAAIAALEPELVLGTQMERHTAKRLRIPCAVISAPVHVQDFPARHSPQMGFEGANVLFDSWVHPLVMGLEEHLLAMFRDDPEFSDEAGASHLQSSPAYAGEGDHAKHGGGAAVEDGGLTSAAPPPSFGRSPSPGNPGEDLWTAEATAELRKIPFFVRGKARRNTENFAAANGRAAIDLVTLYDAKAHYGR